jgi:hypothetical protein
MFFYDRQDDAQEVLEYLILNYPRASRCDEAYATLARIYTDQRNWALAIDRLEKLLLNHPGSPLRPAAQADIPRLRLASIDSPEYDRSAILRATAEFEAWLRAFPGNELESKVRLELADCLRRLSDSDLGIAEFYRRVDNGSGARWHAKRAAEEARRGGDEGRAKDAESSSRISRPTRTRYPRRRRGACLEPRARVRRGARPRLDRCRVRVFGRARRRVAAPLGRRRVLRQRLLRARPRTAVRRPGDALPARPLGRADRRRRARRRPGAGEDPDLRAALGDPQPRERAPRDGGHDRGGGSLVERGTEKVLRGPFKASCAVGYLLGDTENEFAARDRALRHIADEIVLDLFSPPH